jgi:hypothetical protein
MSVQPSTNFGILIANNKKNQVTHFTKENLEKLLKFPDTCMGLSQISLSIKSAIPGKTHSMVSPN